MIFGTRHAVARHIAILALVTVLILRVMTAPFMLASPAPGIMAICSGGKIVYVSMTDMQPVEGEFESPGDPCPFFGMTSVVAQADPPQRRADRLVATILPPGDHLLANAHDARDHHRTRAPPFWV